jgi:hypothetical protein
MRSILSAQLSPLHLRIFQPTTPTTSWLPGNSKYTLHDPITNPLGDPMS